MSAVLQTEPPPMLESNEIRHVCPRIALACASGSALLGIVVLAGWALDMDVLKAVTPGWPAMQANTAVCFVLLAIALALLRNEEAPHRAAFAGRAVAGVACAIATLTLAQDVAGHGAGIDQLLYRDPAEVDHPGRMSPASATALALLGLALMLPSSSQRLAQGLILAVAGLSLFGLTQYVYRVSGDGGLPFYSTMALHTAITFLVLALGALSARPAYGFMEPITSSYAGGALARRLLPIVLGAPLLLSWLRLEGQKAGWYGIEFGLSLMTVAMIVVPGFVIWWNVASLNRSDMRRSSAEQGLKAANQTLETRIAERTQELASANELLLDEAAQRQRAQEELAQRAEDLARSNAELEQFAYVASHDLQEPLRMVASYTQLLAKRYNGQLDPEAHEFIDYAVDGAGRMQELINDLLMLSRVGTRGGELQPSDPEEALGVALRNLETAIEDAGARVTNDTLPPVYADRSQLTQLFQNLIGNAVKFRGARAPEVHVAARRDGGNVVFSVRDNGIGIDAQYAERVFVLFQRLHGRAEYPGTGIGLALCKKIVERHGGRIWVESEPGAGATFSFTMRAANVAAAAAA